MFIVLISCFVNGAVCTNCLGELCQALSVDSVASKRDESQKLDLGKWLQWQEALQPSVLVRHTDDSRMLTELLQYADNMRYNIQPTQTAGNFHIEQKLTISECQLLVGWHVRFFHKIACSIRFQMYVKAA